MEFIKPKSELIIDENYKPNLNNNVIDYFNKALVFAQTNYSDELNNVGKVKFDKLTPTSFIDKYAWCVYTSGMSSKSVSVFFSKILKALKKVYSIFRDFNSSIDINEFSLEILNICQNKQKLKALIKTIYIVQNGIKLFDWEEYRDNFLSSKEKLMVFPYIYDNNVILLTKKIGLSQQIFGGKHLNRLSERWGFENPAELCKTIQKHYILSLLSIELVLWYSAVTFGTNIKS